jgi:hypothetical protein
LNSSMNTIKSIMFVVIFFIVIIIINTNMLRKNNYVTLLRLRKKPILFSGNIFERKSASWKCHDEH